MPDRRAALLFALTLLMSAAGASAQSRRVPPPPKPTPTPQPARPGEDVQPDVRVYTEEVRVPVFARDQYGRFDPSLETDDVLVLEDGVPQQVRSIRRLPASVLLVLNTGGELNAGMRTNVTRALAFNLVRNLRAGDSVAVLQFNRRTELVQDWTADFEAARRSLRAKLGSGSGARHADALTAAARIFAGQPLGNRHVVLVTDGVETPGGDVGPEELGRILQATEASVLGGRAAYAEAYRQLQAAQATVHVVGTGTLCRKVEKEKRKIAPQGSPPGSTRSAGVAVAGIDPTVPPSVVQQRTASGSGAAIEFDPAMRRLRKAYERAQKRGEQQMKALTAETGGLIHAPSTDEELVAEGEAVAREIGTQYVITYTPKRPLAESPATEYRRLNVTPRRGGLTLRARRGYVAAGMRPEDRKDAPQEQKEVKEVPGR
jgi:VWFA-related protein